MAETVPAHVTLLRLDLVNTGRLLAFADVLIDLDGIELRVQGVRVVQRPGELAAEAPQYRRNGVWLPAIVLPPELARAVADLVLAEYKEASRPARAW